MDNPSGDSLLHYGIKRRSGRYPWGSGEEPEQRGTSFLGRIEELKKQGLSETKIAEGLGMKTSEYRAKKTIAIAEQKNADYAQAIRLKDKGCSPTEIGRIMGKNESTIRSILDPVRKERAESLNLTAKILKDAVDSKEFIDVGVGVERHVGVSRTKFQTAVAMLKEEGYGVHYVMVPQLGTTHETSVMVLAKPGVTYSEVLKNKERVQLPLDQKLSKDGRSVLGLEPIQNVSSNRIMVRYHEDGGTLKDGVIELRPGVKDLSMGLARYAQVRIGVDGTHFLKGMAMHAFDMPPGVDIIYNTNKEKGTPKEKVFKEMKRKASGEIDQDNPFGAVIKVGGQRGALNIINEEGDWGEWSKTISSQMLSKQPPALAKKQLDLAYDIRKNAFDEYNSLTNPIVKKKLMDSFADACDSAAVHLKAAALPKQGTHVILPFPTMKETEIYAPNYDNGTRVVLIRHPHGGIFEIPELVVNNNHAEATKVLGRAKDAVGINSIVAERLSGADFDGDSVLVIPNNDGTIKTAPSLKGLIDFNPREMYKQSPDAPRMSPKTKQREMGDISNLITDMTLKGANPRGDEIARAVRHSMVVIDAEKHHLNYKLSYTQNGIAALKEKYQGRYNAGASTLISRASSEKRVLDRKEGVLIPDPFTGKLKRHYVDPGTGRKLYTPTGESYVKRKPMKDGSVKETTIMKTVKSTKMAEVGDAHSLSSGTRMEEVYAMHANKLKAMANEARKTAVAIPPPRYSPSAKETYKSEVSSLNAQLNIALKNAPLERQAQILANSIVSSKKEDNPNMDNADLKKVKGQALAEARIRVGAKKTMVDISDKEWEAIQAGAVSANTLTKIIDNADQEKVKQLATPRQKRGLSTAKLARARQYINSGYTQAEIAAMLDISTSTVASLM